MTETTQYKTANPNSKRGRAIAVMIDNKDKPMAEVLPLISAASEIDVGQARVYYKWIVENGYGPGTVVEIPRAPRQPKADKPTVSKPSLTPRLQAAAKEPAKPQQTKAEKDATRAKNLEKIKATGAKFAEQGKAADGKAGVPDGFDPEAARAEVRAICEDEAPVPAHLR